MKAEVWQARLDMLARHHVAEHQRVLDKLLLAVVLGRTTIAEFEARLIARLEQFEANLASGETDRYGNRFYQVGDLVTRDGTDIHRVVDHNGSDGHAPDGFTVVCVKAPATGWTEVGETEFNVCRRYEPVAPTGDTALPAVGSFHG